MKMVYYGVILVEVSTVSHLSHLKAPRVEVRVRLCVRPPQPLLLAEGCTGEFGVNG